MMGDEPPSRRCPQLSWRCENFMLCPRRSGESGAYFFSAFLCFEYGHVREVTHSLETLTYSPFAVSQKNMWITGLIVSCGVTRSWWYPLTTSILVRHDYFSSKSVSQATLHLLTLPIPDRSQPTIQ